MKAQIVHSKKYKPNTGYGVDTYMRTEFRVDTYYNQNLEFLDRGYDSDEFGDIDDELDGLTIHEPDNTLDAVRFLNGYAN